MIFPSGPTTNKLGQLFNLKWFHTSNLQSLMHACFTSYLRIACLNMKSASSLSNFAECTPIKATSGNCLNFFSKFSNSAITWMQLMQQLVQKSTTMNLFFNSFCSLRGKLFLVFSQLIWFKAPSSLFGMWKGQGSTLFSYLRLTILARQLLIR